jgi:hypothetical protein
MTHVGGSQISLRGAPIGFGQEGLAAPVAAAAGMPWGMALATSVIGAATGWVIEEIATKIRGKRR